MSITKVRAVVVKLEDEPPWIAACMDVGTYDVIGYEDWDEWRAKTLDTVCADWRQYEVREVELEVPEKALWALFAAEPIRATVASDKEER